jgi:ABC-type branched-subunit amino acid transport system substrate-binding protein
MKKLLWAIIAVVIIIVAYNFSRPAQKSSGSIKIGVINPTSGPAGNLGEEVANALKLASTTSVTLSYEDDQCDSKKAISAYQKMKLEGIKIFSVSCSGSVMALAPLAKTDGTLIVTGYAGSAEIRKTGNEVIRFTPDAISIAEAMANYASTLPTSAKIGLFYEDQDYSKSAATLLKEKLGAKIIAEERYTATDTTFRTQLTKLKGLGVNYLFYVPTSDKAAQLVYIEMQTLGFKPEILGDVNVCEYPFAPKEFGLHTTCFDFGFATSTPAYQDFLALYKATYGKEAVAAFNDAVTYDSILAVDEFAKNYKGNNLVPDLKKYLLAGVEGQMTSYKFTPNGEVVSTGNLKKLER